MAEIDLMQFEGHTPGPWRPKELATYQQPGNIVMWPDKGGAHMRHLDYQGGFTKIDARLIAAAPTLLAEVRRQEAEIERLRGALAKARDGLSCGLWDYGPGQSEHDQCDELIAEIDEIIKEQK